MKPRRVAAYFFVAGALFKILLIVLWRLYQPYEAYRLAITYDPVGIFTADQITSIVFPIGIAPYGKDAFFEIVFVIVFGLECVIIGLIFFKLWGLIKSRYCVKNKD